MKAERCAPKEGGWDKAKGRSMHSKIFGTRWDPETILPKGRI